MLLLLVLAIDVLNRCIFEEMTYSRSRFFTLSGDTMKRLFLSLIFFCFATSLIAADLRYIGSSTVGKFIKDASSVYKGGSLAMDTVPESSGGEKCALGGQCEIGGVARSVGKKYLDKGATATLIGKDAIAAVVNAKNKVSGLSSKQLTGIFTGKIKNWKDVGGADLPIKVYIVKKGSATRKVFRAKGMNGAKYHGVKVITPDAKILTKVGREKGAIGQISFAFLAGNKKIKALSVDHQKASLSNPSYPITRPLYLVTKGAPTGAAKGFIDWTLSSAGQKVVKNRFVGVK